MIGSFGFDVRWWIGVALCGLTVVGCGTETKTSETTQTPADSAKASQAPAKAPTEFVIGVDVFCPEICRRTRDLRCSAMDRCDRACPVAFTDMPCPEMLRPAMECALSQPITSWFCSPDGFAAVKDGPCDREQAAYDACLTSIK